MFCSKCGKEIAGDARFCTACGTAIAGGSANSATLSRKKKVRIRPSWIVIGILIVITIISMVCSKNSSENRAAVAKRAEVKAETQEKKVTWRDVKKSYDDYREAKKELDASVKEVKDGWRDVKKLIKAGIREGMQEAGESKSTSGKLSSAEVKSAQKELDAVLEK